MLRTFMLIVVLAVALGAQQTEPYPGQAHHAEPPAGWMCLRPDMDRIGKAYGRSAVA